MSTLDVLAGPPRYKTSGAYGTAFQEAIPGCQEASSSTGAINGSVKIEYKRYHLEKDTYYVTKRAQGPPTLSKTVAPGCWAGMSVMLNLVCSSDKVEVTP